MTIAIIFLVVTNVLTLVCVGVLWRQSNRDAIRLARTNEQAGYWKGYQDGVSSERRHMY